MPPYMPSLLCRFRHAIPSQGGRHSTPMAIVWIGHQRIPVQPGTIPFNVHLLKHFLKPPALCYAMGADNSFSNWITKERMLFQNAEALIFLSSWFELKGPPTRWRVNNSGLQFSIFMGRKDSFKLKALDHRRSGFSLRLPMQLWVNHLFFLSG